MEAQFEDTMEYYQFTNIVSIQKRPFPRREINLVMKEKLPINSAYIYVINFLCDNIYVLENIIFNIC